MRTKAAAHTNTVFPLSNPFPLVDGNYLRGNFGQSEKDISKLRRSLSSPTYWIQDDRKIQYNLRLWEHYVRCVISGGESDQRNHDRLLEYYGRYCDGLLEGVRNPSTDHLQGLDSYLDFLKESLDKTNSKN